MLLFTNQCPQLTYYNKHIVHDKLPDDFRWTNFSSNCFNLNIELLEKVLVSNNVGNKSL